MENEVLKRIGFKVLLLAILLVGMNYIYQHFFFKADLTKYSDIAEQVNSLPQNVDIIYLGESSNVTYLEKDRDKRAISEFINEYLPDLDVVDITKPASHSGIYYAILNQIPAKNVAKTVIVTLNLRSFNAQWIYSDLETPLQRGLVLMRNNSPLVNRLMLSFKDYDIKSKQERERQFKEQWLADEFKVPFPFPHKNVKDWDYWQAMNPIKDSSGNIDQYQTIITTQFIKTYGFQIDTLNNPRIQDFDAIVALAKQRNWNLVFNLMGENTEKAERLVGKELVYFMRENRDLLVNYYGRKGVVVVDNLETIPDSLYVDKDFPTEHYAEKGRKDIAKNVANAIKND